VLDGLVVAGAALVAGAGAAGAGSAAAAGAGAGLDPALAIRLGLSMTALQASIGTLNDLVDAPQDRGRKPGKPIPAGLVAPGTARVVVVLGAGLGVVLAVPSGLAMIAFALVVLGIGYGYDLRAKGTAWSWLPFAIGIPLLPVYGWYGAIGDLAAWFAALLPMAAVAGAALAIGNARVDLERDLDAGTRTVATALGMDRSWWLLLASWGLVGVVAIGSLAAQDVATGGSVVLVLGAVIVVLAATVLSRRGSPARRERSWEVQAIGAAVAAVAWIAAVA
jgi:4-hydroxybenzoate polyprenyltransferase